MSALIIERQPVKTIPDNTVIETTVPFLREHARIGISTGQFVEYAILQLNSDQRPEGHTRRNTTSPQQLQTLARHGELMVAFEQLPPDTLGQHRVEGNVHTCLLDPLQIVTFTENNLSQLPQPIPEGQATSAISNAFRMVLSHEIDHTLATLVDGGKSIARNKKIKSNILFAVGFLTKSLPIASIIELAFTSVELVQGQLSIAAGIASSLFGLGVFALSGIGIELLKSNSFTHALYRRQHHEVQARHAEHLDLPSPFTVEFVD